MKEDILYYRYCEIALRILSKNKSISKDDCCNISPVYGIGIYKELSNLGAGVDYGYDTLEKTKKADELLQSMYFNDKIKLVEEQIKTKELDHESKKASIKSEKTARIALGVSILSLTGLVQMFLKWLFGLVI